MLPTYDYRRVLTMADAQAIAEPSGAEYLRIQGTVRERWINDCVSGGGAGLTAGWVIRTQAAHCEFRKPYAATDTMLCRMHIENLRRVSAWLVFDYYAEAANTVHAWGWQQVVFQDAAHKTCRLPIEFAIAARAILWATPGHDVAQRHAN